MLELLLFLYLQLNQSWLVAGEGRKRNQISVGSCSEVTLPGKVTESDIKALNTFIQAPSGLEEPCFLKKLQLGNLCKNLYFKVKQFTKANKIKQ